jgi:hypothetical protein
MPGFQGDAGRSHIGRRPIAVRRSFYPEVVVIVGDRRQAKHFPVVALNPLQPPHEVVLVKRRSDQHNGAVGGQAGQQVVGEPIPGVLARGLGIGVLSGLDRVVDDRDIGPEPEDGGSDRAGEVAALVVGIPPAFGIVGEAVAENLTVIADKALDEA